MDPRKYHKIFGLLLLYLIQVQSINDNRFFQKKNKDNRFINLAVVSGYVYIGGNSTITLLNSDLKLKDEKPMEYSGVNYPTNWLMTEYKEQYIVICNYKLGVPIITKCLHYNISDKLEFGSIQTSSIQLSKPSQGIRSIITKDNQNNDALFIASSVCLLYDYVDKKKAISSYLFKEAFGENGNEKFLVAYIECEEFVDFKSIFEDNKYIFFLFTTKKSESKLGKLCKNSNGIYTAYEDIPITCTSNNIRYSSAQDAFLWNSRLYVVFNNNTTGTSVICLYKSDVIHKSFKESRIDRLKCSEDVIKSNTVFKMKLANPNSCYMKENETCKAQEIKPCSELFDDNVGFCDAKVFGSVECFWPLNSTEVIFATDTVEIGAILKMSVSKKEEYAVIYAGTSKGKIGKIFVTPSSVMKIGNFFEIDKLSPVLDIKVHGENVYAMTEKIVFNIANKEDCRKYKKSCEDCMKSQNVNCGWDALKKSCNQNSNEYFWVPSAGGKCLDIKVKKAGNVLSAVSFILEPDVKVVNYSRDYHQSVKCEIGQNSFPVYFYENGLFKCDTGDEPVTNSSYSLKIVLNENITVVNKDLLLSCSGINSCSDCVSFECFWCPKIFTCTHNGGGCGLNQPIIEPKSVDQCPRITSNELFITENAINENVTMKVDRLDLFFGEDDNLKCEVIQKNDQTSLKYQYAVINKDNSSVICLNVGSLKKNKDNVVKLKYLLPPDKCFDNNATLKEYTCNGLAKNCGQCKTRKEEGFKCDWCDGKCKSNCLGQSDTCGSISIDEIFPSWGPANGGTVVTILGDNLGNVNQNISVMFGGVKCTDVKVIDPSAMISCLTGKVTTTSNDSLTISVDGNMEQFTLSEHFKYFQKSDIQPELSFRPNKSIKAGGRRITIFGKHIFNDSSGHTYKIQFCGDNNNDESCVECDWIQNNKRPKDNAKDVKSINCKMRNADGKKTLNKMKVTVDGLTEYHNAATFDFVEDPVLDDLPPGGATVFKSGGAKITINGQYFLNVDEAYIDNSSNPCAIKSDQEVVCSTPAYVPPDFQHRRKRSTEQTSIIYFDGYSQSLSLFFVEDPSFENWNELRDYETDSSILIEGSNLMDGAKADDYTIHVGLDGKCIGIVLTNDNITCFPPKNVPRTDHSDEQVVLVKVEVGRIKKELGYIKYVEAIALEIILIAVLSTLFVSAVVIGVVIVMLMRRKKRMAIENFQMELVSREEKIREASREEFADAQMTIRDIKSDIVTSKIPYFDYQTYVFYQLFPNQEMETHPLLHDPMITDDNRSRVKEAMDKFHKLMTNKLFLKSLVQALENMSKLTMKDKANFASLLSVAVMGNMRLFYELVSSLLNEMVQSASKKQHKVLFRRFESITQRLMVNWLEITLYDHLKNQSGMQLFMLYKATQTVIEKGPIDAVTHNCRNTLAEERLLKNRVEYENLTLEIDLNGTGTHRIPVSVLDCDTISQVKQKCITAIYKNKPASEIPTVHDLDLEWHHGRGGKLILQDIDNISDRSNGMIRLNTIKHYMVKDGSEMALLHKDMHEDDPNELYVNRLNDIIQPSDSDEDANQQMHPESPTSLDHVKLLMPDSGEDSLLQWHLSNLTDEEKSNKDHEIGEIFLNRLFHTKLILRDYIDACFEGILDAQLLSVPVRYFLCMIDKLGKDMGVDSDVLQSWKSECYATRVWASLIAKPQILFDVAVPSHVEPCMDILKQVFIDSFTQGTQTVTKDASTQKLLFYKDVPEYRKKVNAFFLRVELVTDQDFWRAMEEISSAQSSSIKFSRQATLQQLYNFIAKYKEEILDDFSEKDEPRNLELGKKLEEVIDLMEDRE